MDDLTDAILVLARLEPPLSLERIATRVHCTAAQVDKVLVRAGLRAGRNMLEGNRSAPVPSWRAATLRVALDLAERGYRVYAPMH